MTTSARLKQDRSSPQRSARVAGIARSAPVDSFPPQAMPRLDGDTGADVCIIGASFVGLRTAYDLLKKGKSVVVIDVSPTLPEQPERDEDVRCARLNDLLTGAGMEEQPDFDHGAAVTCVELAREIVRMGGRIHGSTRALDVSPEHNMQVVTTFDGAIVARVVVVASDEHLLGSRSRSVPSGASFRVLSSPTADSGALAAPHAYDIHPRAA